MTYTMIELSHGNQSAFLDIERGWDGQQYRKQLIGQLRQVVLPAVVPYCV